MAGAILAIGPGEGAAGEAVAKAATPMSTAHMVAAAETAAMRATPMAAAHMPAAAKIPTAGIASPAAGERGA
jgi:hypothetical protein